MWIKNTDGKPDAMLTFAVISFFAVTLNILLATIGQINIGGSIIEFQVLNGTTMGVYLAATFTAYVSRRLTDRHYIDTPLQEKVATKKVSKTDKKLELNEQIDKQSDQEDEKENPDYARIFKDFVDKTREVEK